MATETEWDGGATLWDVDIPLPGDRTKWDFIGDIVGRNVRVLWQSSATRVAWKATVGRVKWLRARL